MKQRTCPDEGVSWLVNLIFSNDITCDVMYSPVIGDSGCSYDWLSFKVSPCPATIHRELKIVHCLLRLAQVLPYIISKHWPLKHFLILSFFKVLSAKLGWGRANINQHAPKYRILRIKNILENVKHLFWKILLRYSNKSDKVKKSTFERLV